MGGVPFNGTPKRVLKSFLQSATLLIELLNNIPGSELFGGINMKRLWKKYLLFLPLVFIVLYFVFFPDVGEYVNAANNTADF